MKYEERNSWGNLTHFLDNIELTEKNFRIVEIDMGNEWVKFPVQWVKTYDTIYDHGCTSDITSSRPQIVIAYYDIAIPLPLHTLKNKNMRLPAKEG